MQDIPTFSVYEFSIFNMINHSYCSNLPS